MTEPVLKASKLRKVLTKPQHLEILKGISLQIGEGEVVSVVGASGAGKTTLLQIMGTLSRQNGGTVEVNGIETSRLQGNQLARFRNRNIGFVFQFHQLCLYTWFYCKNPEGESREAGQRVA